MADCARESMHSWNGPLSTSQPGVEQVSDLKATVREVFCEREK